MEVAAENDVVCTKALNGEMLKHLELGEEIPESLYLAALKIIAFAT